MTVWDALRLLVGAAVTWGGAWVRVRVGVFTPRFLLHHIDLPGRTDRFLICIIYSSSCCRMGAV